jgi:hypothetical protein
MAGRNRIAIAYISALIASFADGQSAAPFPHGIADRANGMAFVLVSGKIDQIDLQAGRLVRSWAVNGEPVGLYAGRVVALERDPQTNSLRVALLEIASGANVHRLPIAFPTTIDARDPRFSYHAYIDGGALILDWRFEGSYSGGAPASPRVARSYATSRSGALKIDLRDGTVSSAASDSGGPASPGGNSGFPYQLRFPNWTSEPWHWSDLTARLESEPAGENKTVVLDTVSGEHNSKSPLVTAHDPFVFLALDGSALIALAGPPERPQRAAVFSVSLGRKIGEVAFPQGLREFAVIGPRIYYLTSVNQGAQESWKLAADDVASGKNLWRLDAGSTPSAIRQTRQP